MKTRWSVQQPPQQHLDEHPPREPLNEKLVNFDYATLETEVLAMIEIVELAPCPHCGGAPEFIERPTDTHVSCKFVCGAKCGFRSPGVTQRLDLPGSRDLHRAWGRTNAAKEWSLHVKAHSR